MAPAQIREAFHRDGWVYEQAAVRHIRVHDARHTYASLMLRRGVLVAFVGRSLATRRFRLRSTCTVTSFPAPIVITSRAWPTRSKTP